MKKLLVMVLMAISLCACSVKTNIIPIESSEVDMSLYRKMENVEHHFRAVTPQEISRVIDEGGSAAFYIGNIFCPTCNKMVYIIEEAAKQSGTTVYYYDTMYGGYTPEDEPVIDLVEHLSPVLFTDERGFKVINTPHVFVVKNGEIISSSIGKPEAGNEDFVEHATKLYREMFEAIK